MARFDPARYPAPVAALLAEPRLMPLDAGAPNEAALEQLRALEETRLCDGHALRNREMASACLAGLWLYHGFLDASLRISQSLRGREGSYWHGIMHRREGGYPDAKYWFRRTGAHPIHEPLGRSARALAEDTGAGVSFGASRTWDAAAFVDLCAAACAGQSGAHDLCRKIQEREWQLLFDYCYRRAVGAG